MLGPQLANLVGAEQPGVRVLFMSGYAAGALGPTNRLDESCVLLRKLFGQSQLLTKLHHVLSSEPAQPARPARGAAPRNGSVPGWRADPGTRSAS